MATFEIKMPKLGESITEGTIISWAVKVGDTIQEDDVLFEVNTAKVSAEIPSPVEGKILKLLFNEGDTVAVGTVVAIVELSGEGEESTSESADEPSNEQPAASAKTETSTAASTKAESPAKTEEKPVSSEKLNKGTEERWYSPVVLEKAKQAKIDKAELDKIEGTGYQGRVSKKNIERYIETKTSGVVITPAAPKAAAQPAAPAPQVAEKPLGVPITINEGDTVIPMDPVRKIIADRMSASKKISPHVTNVVEVDVTKLVRWREENKDEFKKREGISLTYMAPIAEATAKALKDFPRVNSSVDGYNIVERKRINVGIAVSLNDGNLIVPVVKDADKMNLAGLASAITTSANKARANKLNGDEISGGTFTISNFGSFKSLFGTPIINQPEVAILGVGTIEKKPAVVETPEGPVLAIRDKMYLALSYDHRVIDGMLAGNFLYQIQKYLEEWNG